MFSMEGHLMLKLNNACNMNCLFCADRSIERRQPDRPLSEILGEIKKWMGEFDSLAISGGEPTIYKGLCSVIAYAKRCGFKRVSIATNGLMLSYLPFLLKLKAAGLDSVQLSFFASSKAKHDAVSRVPGSWELLLAGLDNIKKEGLELRINCVIHRLNYADAEKIFLFLASWDPFTVNLAFMNPVGDSAKSGKSYMAASLTESAPYIEKAVKRAASMGYGRLYIENFPPCVFSADLLSLMLSKRMIADLNVPSANRDYYECSKKKTPRCSGCSLSGRCPGPYREYIRQFGDSEIRPIGKI